MYRVCIAVVDDTRARLFTFDRAADEAGPQEQLLEQPELVNPVRRGPSLDTGHRPNVFDAHRGRARKHDAEFARTALAALREVIDQNTPQRVSVCAGPRILGTLREWYPGILPEQVPVEELGRDLIQMSPSELRSELVSQGLLPPRPRPRCENGAEC